MTLQINTDVEAFRCFIDESFESFEALGSKIVQLESDPNYKVIVEEIFRPVHGIKGNSGFFGLTNVLGISHNLEDLLQDLRSNKLTISRELINRFFN